MYYEMINRATKTYPFLVEHKNVKYIPHFHEETEVIFVRDGILEVTIGANRFTLKKGDICIFIPEQIHNLYSFENNITFVMKLYSVIDLKDIALKSNIIHPCDKNYEKVCGYIKNIIDENAVKSTGYELAVNINAEKIFLTIIRDMEHFILENKDKTKILSDNVFLEHVRMFLEQNYADSFSLEDIAKHLNYTKSYFCHYFKRTTGITFWRYYTIFRLEKAIGKMIENPRKSCILVAEDSGFRNVRSFNQSFKEYYRCTPREYIKKYCSG